MRPAARPPRLELYRRYPIYPPASQRPLPRGGRLAHLLGTGGLSTSRTLLRVRIGWLRSVQRGGRRQPFGRPIGEDVFIWSAVLIGRRNRLVVTDGGCLLAEAGWSADRSGGGAVVTAIGGSGSVCRGCP